MILIIPHAPVLRYVSIARASRSLRKFSAIIHIVTDDTVQHERAKRAGMVIIVTLTLSVLFITKCNDRLHSALISAILTMEREFSLLSL